MGELETQNGMIVVKLQGGLGNQMFQYAFAKSVAHFYKTSFLLDTDFLLDRDRNTHGKGPNFVFRDLDLTIFNAQLPLAKKNIEQDYLTSKKNIRELLHLDNKKKHYWEHHFAFNKEVYIKNGNTYFFGYWQSEKYFANVASEIRADFTLKHPVLKSSLQLYNYIASKNAVCINFRRTDFLNNALGVTSMEYYQKAMDYINHRVEDPYYFVFSDDIAWCQQNFFINKPFSIIDHSHKGEKFGNYLLLMQSCKHFIIPNSSFAWWAAWLCTYPSKIVTAPDIWFADKKRNEATTDLIPAKWVRL